MNQIIPLYTLLDPINMRSVVVYYLAIVVFIVMQKFLFSDSGDKANQQKIIGGLSVFMIALVANDTSIYFLSLLIGGLIIASEDFMKFIFAIWKSNPDNIGKVVDSFKLATPNEYKEKLETDIKMLPDDTNKDAKVNSAGSRKNRIKEYREVEEKIHQYFRNITGERYVQEIKIENKYGSMIFDAAIRSKISPHTIFSKEELQGRNDLGIDSVLEIKFFKSEEFILHSIQQLLNRILFFKFIVIVRIVIVVENLDQKGADHILSMLNKSFASHNEVQFSIFSYNNGEIRSFSSF